MTKTAPFFDHRIKILCADTLLEINSRLKQLEKENEFLARAVQKTQSDHDLFKSEQLETNARISQSVISILENIFSKPSAITAAKPRPPRKRTAGKGGRHARS